MWTSRVVLLFRCTFRRPADNSLIPCSLAFVNQLRTFTLPEARKSSANHLGLQVEPDLCPAQRDLFREGACPFCTSVIQSPTFESFRRRSSSPGLVWLRAFGWHVAIPHHFSPVSIICAPAFRWRKGRQGKALR